jgi:hypothetical protein
VAVVRKLPALVPLPPTQAPTEIVPWTDGADHQTELTEMGLTSADETEDDDPPAQA